jgi:hypothetical protein
MEHPGKSQVKNEAEKERKRKRGEREREREREKKGPQDVRFRTDAMRKKSC